MGRHIEHYHRTVPFDALLGGAEVRRILPALHILNADVESIDSLGRLGRSWGPPGCAQDTKEHPPVIFALTSSHCRLHNQGKA